MINWFVLGVLVGVLVWWFGLVVGYCLCCRDEIKNKVGGKGK
jgi:hypothetical protein